MKENLFKLESITKIKFKKNSIYFKKFPLFIGTNSNSKKISSKEFFLKKNKYNFLQLASDKKTFSKNQKLYLKSNYIHNTPPPERKGWGSFLGERQFKNIKKYLKNELNILEIGAGSLFFANRVTKEYPQSNYTVVDPFIKKKTKKKNLQILNFFFPSNKLNHKKFDLIILFNCLEHIFDVDKSVKLLNSLLTKNGKVLIEVPETSRQVYESDFNMLTFEHQNYFEMDSLKKLFSKYNLKMIKAKTYNDTIFSVFIKKKCTIKKKYNNFDLRKFKNKLLKIKKSIEYCETKNLNYGIHGANFGAYNVLYLLNLLKKKIKIFDSDQSKVGKYFGTKNIIVKKTFSSEYKKLDILFIAAASYRKEIIKEIKKNNINFKKIVLF